MPKTIKTSLTVAAVLALNIFLSAGEITIKVVQTSRDLPENFCGLWQAGDLLLSDGQYLLLIGGTPRTQKTNMGYPAPNAMGSLLGFVPAGGKLESTMNIGAPVLRIKNTTAYAVYQTVEPAPKAAADGSRSVACSAVFEKTGWGKLEIKTAYRMVPGEGTVVITSTAQNVGPTDCGDLSYSVYMSANHNYSFSPYHKTAHPNLNFRLYPRKGHYLSWSNSNPVEEDGKRFPGRLAPGETFQVRYDMSVDVQPERILRTLYQAQNINPQKAVLSFKNVEGRSMEVVVQELFSDATFFRTFLEEPFTLEILLPAGAYNVRANFFPAVRERLFAVKTGAENLCVIENPAHGTVHVQVANGKGEYVPGKVSVIGLSPTRSPYLRPDNPRETGRSFEAFKNSVYPLEGGLDVKLPAGIYLISASRGPEYSRDERLVEILKDDLRTLAFTIDKVIEIPNLISLEPHIHTNFSDGRMSVPERLKSIVGEGLDVVIGTDHNYVTNYSETLKRLGLNKYLAVIRGSEVTKGGVIHYNSYPVAYIENEDDHGAIEVDPDDVAALFAASRAKNPKAIIQVNHPRSGDLGYFNNFKLDKATAAFAGKGFDLSFMVMEAMNGPTFFRGNQEAIEDWLHLLNRGAYFPIMGSSDAHTIDESEPGFSRTYVYYSGPKGDGLESAAVLQSLLRGRSFVTNGPFIDFKVNGASLPGDTAAAKNGKIDLDIKVSGASWVSVDEVRLIVNGERKIIFPVKSGDRSPEKFRQIFNITLDRDAALVVEALGRKTLYPVVQRQTADGLPQNAVLPYALTNPIFIDVDGNGRFDPLWPDKVKIKDETP